MQLNQVKFYQGVEIRTKSQEAKLRHGGAGTGRRHPVDWWAWCSLVLNGNFSHEVCDALLHWLSSLSSLQTVLSRTGEWTRVRRSTFCFGRVESLRQCLSYFFGLWLIVRGIFSITSQWHMHMYIKQNFKIQYLPILCRILWYFLFSFISFKQKFWHLTKLIFQSTRESWFIEWKITVLSCTIYQENRMSTKVIICALSSHNQQHGICL